jgi:hypothetical protein
MLSVAGAAVIGLVAAVITATGFIGSQLTFNEAIYHWCHSSEGYFKRDEPMPSWKCDWPGCEEGLPGRVRSIFGAATVEQCSSSRSDWVRRLLVFGRYPQSVLCIQAKWRPRGG